MDFAAKLKKLIKDKGWNKAILAERIGTSKSSAGRWVDGKVRPYDPIVVQIARVLGVSLEYLLDDNISEQPKADTPEERALIGAFRGTGLTLGEAAEILTDAIRSEGTRKRPPD